MPSDFPRGPKVLKGALAVYASQSAETQPDIIAFQYNPDQLSRTLAARAAPREPGNVGAAREVALRAVGPSVENINLSVVLDAADQLEELGLNRPAVEHGPGKSRPDMVAVNRSRREMMPGDIAARPRLEHDEKSVTYARMLLAKSRYGPPELRVFRLLGNVIGSVALGGRAQLLLEEFRTSNRATSMDTNHNDGTKGQ